MVKTLHTSLSRRERQIIDILYRRGRATAAEVMEDLPGDPSYSTVPSVTCTARRCPGGPCAGRR